MLSEAKKNSQETGQLTLQPLEPRPRNTPRAAPPPTRLPPSRRTLLGGDRPPAPETAAAVPRPQPRCCPRACQPPQTPLPAGPQRQRAGRTAAAMRTCTQTPASETSPPSSKPFRGASGLGAEIHTYPHRNFPLNTDGTISRGKRRHFSPSNCCYSLHKCMYFKAIRKRLQ